MRDYAEIGWRVQSGRRRGRTTTSSSGVLARAWQALASLGTTTALLVVTAAVLLLEASGTGPVLPVADPGRLGPLALRVTLVLLGANLLAVFLQRLLPALLPRRATAADLAPALAVEHRAPLPDASADPDLERVLHDAGLTAVRRAGPRRAIGLRGTVPMLGAVLATAGAGCLLVALVTAIDDPAPGELSLIDGETVETLRYDTRSADPLEVFLGLRFTLRESDALVRALEGDPQAAGALEVEYPNGGTERVALRPASTIGLGDGSWLRLASLRTISKPTRATLRVVPPGGSDGELQEVALGRGLRVGGATLTVTALRTEFLENFGPAVQLAPARGRPFWVFGRSPELSTGWPHLDGHRVELVELSSSHVVTLERFVPQSQTLPAVGLALLVLGAVLLLAASQLSVEVTDEVDRVVVRTSSINNALAAVAAGPTVASAVTAALSDASAAPQEELSEAPQGRPEGAS